MPSASLPITLYSLIPEPTVAIVGAVAEVIVAGLDDRQPGLFVARARGVESAVGLERQYGGFGRVTKCARLGAVGAEPGGAEAALQISDGFAALAATQGEVARNPSISWSRAPFESAPVTRPTGSPPLNMIIVGIDITL